MNIRKRADITTFGGALLAIGGLGVGLRLEGIQFADVAQVTAALVVFCGTAGAVLISTPLAQVRSAVRIASSLFRQEAESERRIIDKILSLARGARGKGLMSLEQEVELLADSFLKKGMRLAVDNMNADTILSVLEADLQGFKAEAESAALVFETAGGYAPTLGMAGAALSLIQVLKHLSNIQGLGTGVATAFVAIIYGVLLANLVLLPISTKIRARAEVRSHACLLMRDGILSIVHGLNPSLIRLKLYSLAQIADSEHRRPGIRSMAA